MDTDADAAAAGDLTDSGGPVLALRWTRDNLEALGLVRLDISPSAAMATLGIEADPDEATRSAAWRLLEAGDTLGISQVESVGFRMLLKRAHELAELQSPHGHALRTIEDLAQLLALWKRGVYSKEREEDYFDARYAARERPTYPHPAMAAVLDKSFGEVLHADQIVDLVKLLGFDHAWAERFRRAIAGGRAAGRDVMEGAIREAGARQRWTTEQSNALLALLIQHVGYLHLHGHALSMAQHVFRQACLKVNPASAPAFFAEVLNNGGSSSSHALNDPKSAPRQAGSSKRSMPLPSTSADPRAVLRAVAEALGSRPERCSGTPENVIAASSSFDSSMGVKNVDWAT